MTHAYDQFNCPFDGCPWSCAWECRGSCQGAPTMLSVPLDALVSIGKHRLWHERDDVRQGLVAVEWSDSAQNFVEVPATSELVN